jgi:PAS domain S-box-containing protein
VVAASPYLSRRQKMPSPLFILAIPAQQGGPPYRLLFFGMTGVIFVGLLVIVILLLRRFSAGRNSSDSAENNPIPRADNAPAFMAASVQAVIQRLREEQRELDRQLRSERERAEAVSQFHEEVIRNMPAGMLVIGANGLVSASNPAAEKALGIQSMSFRRHSEIFGESSTLSALIERCLKSGESFRGAHARHVAPDGDFHDLNVTVVPLSQPADKSKIALCLFTDLTDSSTATQDPLPS